jgi:hypothetical protein
MWIYLTGSNMAINTDHITRFYVEETGSGAALKADVSGKTMMVTYHETKADAVAALAQLMEKREANMPVMRF